MVVINFAVYMWPTAFPNFEGQQYIIGNIDSLKATKLFPNITTNWLGWRLLSLLTILIPGAKANFT